MKIIIRDGIIEMILATVSVLSHHSRFISVGKYIVVPTRTGYSPNN